MGEMGEGDKKLKTNILINWCFPSTDKCRKNDGISQSPFDNHHQIEPREIKRYRTTRQIFMRNFIFI